MRLRQLLLLICASLTLSGCAAFLRSEPPPARWTTGFWFWDGSSYDATLPEKPVDVLFAQVGTIRSDPADGENLAQAKWLAYGRIPDGLPAAREYWLVFRYDRQGLPNPQAVDALAGTIADLSVRALHRHLNVAGVQLDIDCPTAKLDSYAKFLRELKQRLPQGWRLSITGLLDWFRDGTSVGDVVNAVDEYVPQFYDVADLTNYDGPSAIALKIDAERWGPRFNRFQKPFRVGISSFGRARPIRNERIESPGYARIAYRAGDPLELATNGAFTMDATHNQAGELVLSYRAVRPVHISYEQFAEREGVQFILSTPESIAAAVASAKKMAGRAAGMVFFRWPSSNDALTMQPGEVQEAAGEFRNAQHHPARIRQIDGECALVRCLDLYLEGAAPLSSSPLRYRVRSSVELEYFLPEERTPLRMKGRDEMEVSLPPYCARGVLYLGRAVSKKPVEFIVEAAQ